MTRVIFYSNLADKQVTLANLVHQALEKKHQVSILTEDERAANVMSAVLWSNNKIGFVPNVLSSHRLASETPVVIDWQEKALFQDDILINLTQQQPLSFSRFRELIELVGNGEEDKAAARLRYKFYRDRGYEIKHIDQQRLTN